MGGVLTDIMTITTDNDYSLARDLIGLALADGKITEEEKAAIARICQLDNMDWIRYLRRRDLVEGLRNEMLRGVEA